MPDEPEIRAVFGLGNPGATYRETRHNAGFLFVDRLKSLATGPSAEWTRECRSRLARVRLRGRPMWLVKPQTYMNLSGEAFAMFTAKFELGPEQVLVVSDDLALPLGVIRLRPHGSDGGHNGLRSIIEHARTRTFPRLRIGIGAPSGENPDAAEYVLAPFPEEEREPLRGALDRACQAFDVLITAGLGPAMGRFNAIGG